MSEDKRDPETIKQMRQPTFPPPQRKTPLPQSAFTHQHKWDAKYAGPGRRCESCGLVLG